MPFASVQKKKELLEIVETEQKAIRMTITTEKFTNV